MPKRKRYHVTKRDDGWAVKEEKNQRASSIHRTKQEAVDDGRERARKARGQLLIHKQNGQIQEERTYENDPYPPPG